MPSGTPSSSYFGTRLVYTSEVFFFFFLKNIKRRTLLALCVFLYFLINISEILRKAETIAARERKEDSTAERDIDEHLWADIKCVHVQCVKSYIPKSRTHLLIATTCN